MDIELRTQSQDTALALRDVRPFREGQGFGFECNLEVRSRGFAATIPFVIEHEPVTNFLTQLDRIDRDVRGQALLKPVFEDPYIEFEVLRTGHVKVRGSLIVHSEMTQEMRFEFATDQTVLRPFLEDLHRALNMRAT